MTTLTLGSKILRPGCMPYIIAEIGVNHGGDMQKARELISLAKEGGADAAKFQTYKAETLAAKQSPSYWDTTKEPTLSQFELFKKYDCFDEADYRALAEHCDTVGIDFLSTPFDDAAIDFLGSLMPFYKIASADLTNIPFLRRIAKKGKPVVLSTGCSTLAEIDMAVAELQGAGCTNLALLHCVLNYPTPDANAHLGMIDGLKRAYPDFIIGYSDHTLPDSSMLPLTAAYLKGALIIEKHFTHDKTLPGNDHYHAMDVDDLRCFTANLRKLGALEGWNHKKPIPDEAISRRNARRSIVTKGSLAAGSLLSESNITYKRPAHGISPLHWDEVLGRKVKADLPDDHILQWSDLL